MTDLELVYRGASILEKQGGMHKLLLAHQTEIEEINQIPCFFWGTLTDAYMTAKCWMTISKVVKSNFGPVPLSYLCDPIVTAGAGRLRFEGFSSCNGVYVRLDMKPEAVDGEFIASGTTNVDFNDPMLNALNAIQKNERVMLAVGEKELQLISEKSKVTEKKVRLPMRWVKGLSSVQLYLADMVLKYEMERIQAIQLFQNLPKGILKGNFSLEKRGEKFMFATTSGRNSVRIGGIARLRLLEGLLPLLEKMSVYESADRQSCAFVCDFGHMQLLMAFSPEPNRGFSGEGKALDYLNRHLPVEWVYALGGLLKSNEIFDPLSISFEHYLDYGTVESLIAGLSSMGLLGYDLTTEQHFYRRLPFKTERILSINPRLKNARKLLEMDQVEILEKRGTFLEARVRGSDVWHKVVLDVGTSFCTCNWFTNHQGKRGVCKHILAVRMLEEK